MKRYTYKTKDGRTVESDKPINNKEFVLVTRIYNGQMSKDKISKK